MIKSLRIAGFKSLLDVTTQLDPLTVLIGRSGAGKSNFVKAMRFLRDVLKNREFHGVANSLGGWQTLLPFGASQGTIQFDVVFDVGRRNQEFKYSVAFGVVVPMPPLVELAESLAVNDKFVFSHHNGRWHSKPPIAGLPDAVGGLQLGVLYGIPEVRLAHLALAGGIGCYDFPSTILQLGNYQAAEDSALNDFGTNFLRTFEGIANDLGSYDDWLQIIAGLQQINPTVRTLDLETTQRNRVLVGHQMGEGSTLGFALSDESEGFRRFLAHLLCLYQNPGKATMIFEEPEKGLYPGALSALADFFKSHVAKHNSQIVITTHSPNLLDYFPAGSLRVVEMDQHKTVIGPLAPEQSDAIRQRLMTTGELLTVDQARIEAPTKA